MKIVISEQSIPASKSAWVLFVAIERGKVIGSCRLASIKSDAPQIDTLFVERAYRRKGLATELISEAINWAKKAGKESVGLSVHKKNKSALALYRKLGFGIWYDDNNLRWMGLNIVR